MIVYAVDVGTTNIKVALFDERLRRLALTQAPVTTTAGEHASSSTRSACSIS